MKENLLSMHFCYTYLTINIFFQKFVLIDIKLITINHHHHHPNRSILLDTWLPH